MKSSVIHSTTTPTSPSFHTHTHTYKISTPSLHDALPIWAMDYDGANQHALTHLGSISLSPRVSPDGSRVAFSSLTKSGWEILMYSLELDRLVTFARSGGHNLSSAWSSYGPSVACPYTSRR